MGRHGPDMDGRVRVGSGGFAGGSLRFQQVCPQRLGAGLASTGKHRIEGRPGVQLLVKETPHRAVVELRGSLTNPCLPVITTEPLPS